MYRIGRGAEIEHTDTLKEMKVALERSIEYALMQRYDSMVVVSDGRGVGRGRHGHGCYDVEVIV